MADHLNIVISLMIFFSFNSDTASRHSGRRSCYSQARSHFMEAIETISPSFLRPLLYCYLFRNVLLPSSLAAVQCN